MKNNNSTSHGITFFGMLAILFIGLKLTDHIDWSWWWVLAPLWLPLTVFLTVLLVAAVIVGICDK